MLALWNISFLFLKVSKQIQVIFRDNSIVTIVNHSKENKAYQNARLAGPDYRTEFGAAAPEPRVL